VPRNRQVERAAFWLTVVVAGATFWIAPRPPMADLPQHAGQIALWHDLLTGTSKWQSAFYINLYTPYWLGNGLALLLSFAMPVSAAMKLLLMVTYWAFVAGSVLLRRRMAADQHLDWLFVCSFFGLAYEYGLFPFLIAAPIGVAFIVLAHRHAERPSPASGALLCLTGLALYFSHGLTLAFAGVIGAAFLVLKGRSFMAVMLSGVPYVVLAGICLAYALLGLAFAPGTSAVPGVPQWPGLFSGMKHLLFFPIGAPRLDWLLAPLVPLLLLVPLLAGCGVNRRNYAAFVPIGVLLAWVVAIPESVGETWFIAYRFTIFLLPFFALPFLAPRRAWARWIAPALSWAFLVIHGERLAAFAKESDSFEQVLAAAAPGFRAQSVVLDPVSRAAQNPMAYVSFPLWYQADKGGLVDFNFAYFPTQVVRFREVQQPKEEHRYYFVRRTDPSPEKPMAADAGAFRLLKSSGDWSLFEKVGR
jgi:hypothetical protein